MISFPATDLLLSVIFVFCLGLLVFGALVAVSSSRLIRSVFGLAICCFGLAGLYYFLRSPFLALMEILIYVGAVCVTIVFAVMLAEPDEPPRTEKSGSTVAWGGLALLIVAAIGGGLIWIGCSANWPTPGDLLTDGSVAAIGRALLTTYSMAFELISVALLIAILGALAIARAGRTRPEPPNSRDGSSSQLPTLKPSGASVLATLPSGNSAPKEARTPELVTT